MKFITYLVTVLLIDGGVILVNYHLMAGVPPLVLFSEVALLVLLVNPSVVDMNKSGHLYLVAFSAACAIAVSVFGFQSSYPTFVFDVSTALFAFGAIVSAGFAAYIHKDHNNDEAVEQFELALKLIVIQALVGAVVGVALMHELFSLSFQSLVGASVVSILLGICFLYRVSIGAIVYYVMGQVVILSIIVEVLNGNLIVHDALFLPFFLMVALYSTYAAKEQLKFASKLRKAESPTPAD